MGKDWWKPIPVVVAGVAGGGYIWGVFDKAGWSSGPWSCAALAAVCCCGGYIIWRALLKTGEFKTILSDAGGFLPFWLLGLMPAWRRLGAPHLGAWLLFFGAGGFLWMGVWQWTAKRAGRNPGAGKWAVPLGAALGFIWEAFSGDWNLLRLLVVAQLCMFVCFLIGGLVSRLGSGGATIMAVLITIIASGVSYGVHGPHCDRLEDSAAFRCFAEKYKQIGFDAAGWKAEGLQRLKEAELSGVKKPAAIVHAPAIFVVKPLEGRRIDRFYFGMMEECWNMPGDGVRFTLFAEQGGKEKRVAEKYIDPKHSWKDRSWIEVPIETMEAHIQMWEVKISAGPEIQEPFRRTPDSRADWAVVGVGVVGNH